MVQIQYTGTILPDNKKRKGFYGLHIHFPLSRGLMHGFQGNPTIIPALFKMKCLVKPVPEDHAMVFMPSVVNTAMEHQFVAAGIVHRKMKLFISFPVMGKIKKRNS
jgi:hypothetical protein